MIYIINYTDGLLANEQPVLWEACLNRLKKAAQTSGATLVTIQNNPDAPRNHVTLYNNILSGIDKIPEKSIIYLAEHDVLYPDSFFTGEVDHPIEYNTNSYILSNGAYYDHPYKTLSNCRGQSDYLYHAILKKLEESKAGNLVWAEPDHKQARTFQSKVPTIDIRHTRNFTSGQILQGKRQDIPGWPGAAILTKKLGLNPGNRLP